MASSSRAPTVGIVTVAYRSDDVLAGFLESAARASTDPVHLVVVDNAPDAGTAAATADRAGARYITLPQNPGYGAAVNVGVRELPASVQWVLISNPDIVLEPGSVDKLRDAGQADDSIGAIGPTVLNPDGSVYPSARAIPSIRTGVGHAVLGNMWEGNPWTRSYLRDEDPSDEPRDAGWLSGSCLLVRRSAFDELNGFDEDYFMYFEDVDLGFRLGNAGYRNRYEPAARVTHSGAHSTSGSESARMIAAHHESARRFLRKKHPEWYLAPVRAVIDAGLAVRSGLSQRRARRRGQR